MKRILLSIIIALPVTALVGWISQTPGKHWVDHLVFVCELIGVFISGNLHQPDLLATWGALFLMIFAIVLLCVYLVATIMNRMHLGGAAWAQIGAHEAGQTVPNRPAPDSKKGDRRN